MHKGGNFILIERASMHTHILANEKQEEEEDYNTPFTLSKTL